MNLVYSLIFIITAIFVAIFDYKYQKIPLWIVIINYISLSLIINPILLIGLIAIILCKKFNKPIDGIYLLIISYLIIIDMNAYNIISVIILLVWVIATKKDTISFMVPIEIVCIIEIIRRLVDKWLVCS